MPPTPPTLHMVCGKAASGKSTLASQLGAAPRSITLREDEWLAGLYSDQLSSLSDYARCAARLQDILGPHIQALLGAGNSVVLDFQANTRERRLWMRGILETTGARHILHYLDVPDEVCLARLSARNASGEHPFALTEEQFKQLSKYFVAPSADEGFDIEYHPIE